MPNEDDHYSFVGTYMQHGRDHPFLLSRADRRQHTYILGKTGSGKSTLLKNLIAQDLAAGTGVGLLDPHGDLAADILDHIPPSRTDDLVYFNPSDLDHPIGLNLLHHVPPKDQPVTTSGVVDAFKSIYADSWGPRLEYILSATVAALLNADNTSLLGVPRMLSEDGYRRWVVDQLSDPMVRQFWTHEFARYNPRLAAEAVAPIQNKIGQFLMHPAIRNTVGQIRSRIDARFIMDRQRIFIANLSKGSLGSDKARLLGAFLVSWFERAAHSRTNAPERQRPDFNLYVDELQNFTTESFASILSEARKYNLSLTISHQYLDQLPKSIRHAILGNVGNLFAFRLGERDARMLAPEFKLENPSVLTDLGRGKMYVRMLSANDPIEPFHASTLLPELRRYGRVDNLIDRSRQRYGTPRQRVEDRIDRWLRNPFGDDVRRFD